MSEGVVSEGGTGGRRRWLLRGALLALSSTAALLLAEVVVRVSGLAPPRGVHTVTEGEYLRYPGIFAPDQQGTESPGTRFEHQYEINGLGYRGADFPREKPADELRVLVVGDSFTWGHNVEDYETLPARLEVRLGGDCGPVGVVNAGLSGTTILAHSAQIERGLVLQPDLVLLVYHENDIDELIYSRMWEQLEENRRVKSRFPVSIVYPVVRGSALWSLALHVRRTLLYRRQEPQMEAVETSDAGVDGARAEYARRLESVVGTLRDVNVPFVMVLYPHPDSVRRGEGGRDYAWVLEAAASLGVETLDLLPRLAASGVVVEDLYLVPDDYHPSPTGHDVAAGILADELRAGVVAGSCP